MGVFLAQTKEVEPGVALLGLLIIFGIWAASVALKGGAGGRPLRRIGTNLQFAQKYKHMPGEARERYARSKADHPVAWNLGEVYAQARFDELWRQGTAQSFRGSPSRSIDLVETEQANIYALLAAGVEAPLSGGRKLNQAEAHAFADAFSLKLMYLLVGVQRG
jgi:hypothetical protein